MSVSHLDSQLFDLVNHRFHFAVLDVAMAALSTWVLWKPLVLLAAMLALVFGGFKERALVCCAVVSVLIADAGVANALKHLAHRPRPYQAMADVRVVRLKTERPRFLAFAHPAVITLSTLPSGRRDNRSFPSGHTINNFAFGTVLTWFYRKRGWLYFIVATLVGWSRIYVGDHYPTDVLSAAVIGGLVALITMLVIEWLWRSYASRLSPAIASAHPTLIADDRSPPSDFSGCKNE
jgi:membrane-associated phospholipid phosphatase